MMVLLLGYFKKNPGSSFRKNPRDCPQKKTENNYYNWFCTKVVKLYNKLQKFLNDLQFFGVDKMGTLAGEQEKFHHSSNSRFSRFFG